MEKITLAERMFGTSDTIYIKSLIICALIGVAINLLFHSLERNPKNPENPEKYNLWFLVKDNARRIALGVLLVFVSMRFSEFLFGTQISEFTALLIGLSYDRLGQVLQKNDILIGKNK